MSEPKYPITLKIKPSEDHRAIIIKAQSLLRDSGATDEETHKFWCEAREQEEMGYGHLIDFLETQFTVEYGG